MSFSKSSIDITPDKSLLPTLGNVGYSVPQAVAELVDNSIDERVEGKNLVVEVTISRNSIKVVDNAKGMSPSEAGDAFVLGKSTKAGKIKLGLYGLGLKTSCASLGSRYYIKTKTGGADKWFILEFEEEAWLTNKELGWSNFPVHYVEGRRSDHGTTVEIDRLRKQIPPSTASKILEDFSIRYRPLLEKEGVRIVVNGKACRPKDLELTEKHGFDRVLPSGQRIHGWFGLTRESNQTGYYGFNTFRHGRMITCFDKIGFNPHATLARIVGELNLDHVPVTHDKRDFLRDSEQFIEVDMILRINPEFRAMQLRARTPQKGPKKPVPEGMNVDVVDESTDQNEKSIGEVLQSIVRINLQDKCPVCDETLPNPSSLCPRCGSTTGLSDGSAGEVGPEQNGSSLKVEIDDRSILVHHSFSDLGCYGPMFKAEESSDAFRVTTNVSFPAYKSIKDGRFFAALSICFALAQLAKRQDRLTIGEWVKTQERLLLYVPDIIRALQDSRGSVQKSHAQESNSRVIVATASPVQAIQQT